MPARPVIAMRPSSPRPLLLCIALLLACGHAAASQSRQLDADGSGACPEATATGNERAEDADEQAGTASPARRAAQKPRPAASATPRTGGGNERVAPPRWHSFLPGMIR